jgi:hypothetical protein
LPTRRFPQVNILGQNAENMKAQYFSPTYYLHI